MTPEKILKENDSLFSLLLSINSKAQLVVSLEELSELSQQIGKVYRGKYFLEDVLTELADALIVIRQLQLFLKLSDEDLAKEIELKIARTRERLACDIL